METFLSFPLFLSQSKVEPLKELTLERHLWPGPPAVMSLSQAPPVSVKPSLELKSSR